MTKRLLLAVVVFFVQLSSSAGLGAPASTPGARGPLAAREGARPKSQGDRRRTARPPRKILVESAVPSEPEDAAETALPRDPGPRIRMARWLLERGDPARAYVEATGALIRDPESAEAYFLRGSAALDLGMTLEATFDLESAVILAPDYGQAFEQLGFAFLLAGDTKKAADAFGRASALLDERGGGADERAARASLFAPSAPRAERARYPAGGPGGSDPSSPPAKQPEEDVSGADLQAAPDASLPVE